MKLKNNTQVITVAVIVAVVIVGSGMYWLQQGKVQKEPLTYATSGVSATVSKSIAAFDYTAEQLTSMAEECGSEQGASYFNELVTKFSDTNKTIYDFKYTGASQNPSVFRVTLLPNVMNYVSFDEFKKDFDICAVGGTMYPNMMNENWLLFVNSCGSGFDDESGRPIGCQEVKDVVGPTLRLN